MAGALPVRRTPGWLRGTRYAFVAFVIFVVLFGYQTAVLYTDWQWFRELKHAEVFSTILGARVWLFLGFGLLFFLICYSNLWLARKLNAGRTRPMLYDRQAEQLRAMAQTASGWLALAAAIFMAFVFGGQASSHWSDYLQFTHAAPFGASDPIFGRDIGFFLFRLPFLSFLVDWIVLALILTLIGTAVIHYAESAADLFSNVRPSFPDHARKHVLALLGLTAIAYAAGYTLSRYDLLYTDNGAFFGAGYTDLHVRLPSINLQMICMVLTGVLCIANIWVGRPFRLPIGGLALWLVVTLIGTVMLPGGVEKFQVIPNQFNMERQYIAHDIKLTQAAYGLGPDKVKVKDFSGAGAVTAANIATDRATINNIRLWDWPQLSLVYSANQALRKYYRFGLPPGISNTAGDTNIDVDRYTIHGDYRQVMLAPRELYPPSLPEQAQTWQNVHLQYTHGYGVVMSPVNRVTGEGLPEYFLSQIPVQSTAPELEIKQPQIYFGDLTRDYVFVDTKQSEFDYPAEAGNKETRYTGTGGSPLGGSLGQLMWSMRLGDTTMLFSSDLTSSSRILFRRSVRERVQTLAPFLSLDNDPYIVVDNGRILWVQDAYTTSNRYPYSKPTTNGVGSADDYNYIRNSVKAVVDAYDGTVTLYIADKTDPIIRTWSRIFPGLFTPMEKMPDSLKAHMRYPEDLFRAQREIYKLYHINDERVYYGKEDAWDLPGDPTGQSDGENQAALNGAPTMMPYYVVMRLPGEQKEEFLMMTPFTPLSKQNISAWMCAKCDPDDYGTIQVYRFPRGSNVNGPQQVMSQVNATREISEYTTLLGQRGSRVVFGNLLVIPIESSLLYAIPVYVQANAPGSVVIPEINQVIVATANKIVMRPNLETAIAALTEGQAVAAGGSGQAAVGSGQAAVTPNPQSAIRNPQSVPELVRRANSSYQQARQREKEYQKSLDDLGKALDELQRGIGTGKK